MANKPRIYSPVGWDRVLVLEDGYYSTITPIAYKLDDWAAGLFWRRGWISNSYSLP